MRKLFVITLVSLSNFVFAQYTNFTPLPITDTLPTSFHRAFKLRLEKDKADVSSKGKVGNYMKTLYDQRFSFLVDIFNKDYIILEDEITHYLGQIQTKIYEANPQLLRETNVYTYRSGVPNAISFGEGSICIMLGLLERLETEDQLAFVLCHELAHYHSKHAEKKIAQLAEANYDKGLKKEIDAIMSSPYDRYNKLKKLFTGLDFSLSHHSRTSEFEADSIGLVYYLKTGYNPGAPLSVMQILDKADSSLYRENIDFKKYFNFKEFPFKESWIEYKKSDVWHAPLKENDTATTHPQCLQRFASLQRQLSKNNKLATDLRQGKTIEDFRFKSALEIVHSEYHFKKYGKALFRALVLSETYPDNMYLQAMIAKSLYQLYLAQKNHQLGKVLELPDPRYEENYDRFLTFIHTLRLTEIAILAYQYIITRPGNFYTDEEILHALWLCSKLNLSKVDPESVRLDYETLYPKGKYIKEMKK